ncbi:hypothetical protein LJC26_01865 [Desulfovibrio sp. OttesenSCG-928-O18]|nr:hypothetical protein [Desulfovibrio sp. OttesenSCG-928-O18]
MASIVPEGELLRRAAAWICEEREAKKEKSLYACLDEAGMRFNLSPKDQRMLAELFSETNCPQGTSAAGRPD